MDGAINKDDHTIVVTLPFGTNVSSLTPVIMVSDKATVTPTTAQNFTKPVTYTVKAENESTQTYTITVSVTKNSDKTLVSVAVPTAISGLTNGTAKTTSALGLPSTVTLVTSDGNVSANVTWDVASCSYDARSSGAQTFIVSGTVTLPTGVVNTNSVSLTTAISVSVMKASSSSSSSGSGSYSSASYQATVTGSDGSKTTRTVATSGSSAAVTVGTAQSNLLVSGGTLVLTMPTVTDATSYGVNLPASSLSAGAGGVLTMDTGLGSISLPSNMLSSLSGTTEKTAQITISNCGSSSLPDSVKVAIGGRPIIQLSLSLNGTQSEWSNPGAPVTVSIPYTLASGEDTNKIVVYYISGSGKLVMVPDCIYDASTGTVTFKTTHFSNYAVAYNDVSFSDVSNSAWYADYVAYLAARGIVSGNNGAFKPDEGITRVEFVTILARMSGESLSGYTTSTFSDVAIDSWYFAAVQWANKAGIVSGYDGKFTPNDTITREQMAAMLYRYAEYKGTVSNTEGMSVRESSDYDSISSWAQAPIQWAMNNKILSGNTDGSFAPQSSATRAQAAKMLTVLMQGMVKRSIT